MKKLLIGVLIAIGFFGALGGITSVDKTIELSEGGADW